MKEFRDLIFRNCKRAGDDKCNHVWRYLKWIKKDEIVCFYCVKCMIMSAKWCDFPVAIFDL